MQLSLLALLALALAANAAVVRQERYLPSLDLGDVDMDLSDVDTDSDDPDDVVENVVSAIVEATAEANGVTTDEVIGAIAEASNETPQDVINDLAISVYDQLSNATGGDGMGQGRRPRPPPGGMRGRGNGTRNGNGTRGGRKGPPQQAKRDLTAATQDLLIEDATSAEEAVMVNGTVEEVVDEILAEIIEEVTDGTVSLDDNDAPDEATQDAVADAVEESAEDLFEEGAAALRLGTSMLEQAANATDVDDATRQRGRQIGQRLCNGGNAMMATADGLRQRYRARDRDNSSTSK